MPAYRTQVTHRFSHDESIDRLSRTAERIGSTCALVGSWKGDTYSFSAKVLGIGLSGRLRADDGAMPLDASLPLIALPFKGWFPRILSTALEMGGESSAAGSTPASAFPPIPGRRCSFSCTSPRPVAVRLASISITQCRDPQGLDEGLVNSGVYFCLKLEGQMSLEEFGTNSPYMEVKNDQTRRIAGVDPEVGGCDEATLQLAIDNLRRDFAVVGTVERLDETLANLRLSFGWTAEVACVTRNADSDRPALASLPAKTIAAIRAGNELDYALFAHVNTLMDSLLPTPLPCNT